MGRRCRGHRTAGTPRRRGRDACPGGGALSRKQDQWTARHQWTARPDAASPVQRGQPDQRPDPRLRRADEAADGRGVGGAPACPAEATRGGGPPRHRLAPAPAPDQPAPERALGLPHGRALALHPWPRGHARGRALGTPALPVAPDGADSPQRAGPERGPRRRDVPGRRPPPRRGPWPVRPLLRRPRPRELPCPARPAPGPRQAAHPRGPLAADHRARAGRPDPRPAPRAGRPVRARRLRRRRSRSIRRWVSFLVSKPALARPRDADLGRAGSSHSCRACSRSTTSTTSGATPG